MEKYKDDIVLVILDIIMPVMDGFAFMEEFKKRESIRNIPIVVATTENDFETEKRCLELGVWDFIPKIFQPEIIRFRVFNTIKRSMAHSLEHDKLTGLYTVQKFSQRVQGILEENTDTKFTFVRLDIDVLKIDMRFLSKGSSEERSEKILEAVIKMAKSLDMQVIAEGVEEENR